MSPSQHPPPPPESSKPAAAAADDNAADLAQAYKDLVRGEQAAAALESNLTNLESKLDALLAAFETAEAKTVKSQPSDKKESDKDAAPKK
jgi:hypothetical protein